MSKENGSRRGNGHNRRRDTARRRGNREGRNVFWKEQVCHDCQGLGYNEMTHEVCDLCFGEGIVSDAVGGDS